jgi:adenine-specific DNA-methyltransferase
MIEQQRVYRIKDLDSLLVFLREDLCWDLPDASIDDVSFEWTGLDLNLSEDVNKKLKDGLIRQLQPFATHQPWGIFVVEFATREVSIITLRQILRCFVAKRRGARPDLPAWQCENLLFICLYGENGFTFAHFKGDKPYSSKLTTFSWHPGEPVRTVCEFNLPALVYDYTWTPETWVEEWQKAFDVEKVNKDFYKQIARFYYRLTGKEGQKRELVLPYVGDDSGSISIYEEFAVRLIGRSIFCWFLKHKESANDVPLIPSEALSLAAARKTADFYHSMLEPLFFEVMSKRINERKSLSIPRSEIIPFLNGGLFEQHPNDFYADVPNYGLKIPDTWFIDFFSLLERYNFTITENSSIDVDVAVDPEMLGRIFENLLAEVVPETGETARKATGSYYTPRAIVDYMVEQSLKQYLLTKTNLPKDKLDSLLSYEYNDVGLSNSERNAIVTALKEIKVIDPACGSGAFPMGILHRMLLVLEKVDPTLEVWKRLYLGSYHPVMRKIIEDKLRKGNEQYIRKLTIIQDSIYGVDIQPIAVEIAKLRCFLSLVVDELVLDREENRGIEPLPNLEFKFVAANTLIGLPSREESQGAFGASEAIKKLKDLRESYLRSFGAEKAEIEKEFRATQRTLLEESLRWQSRSPVLSKVAEQLTEWDPFSYESCSWFDQGWMFGMENGFDIVIANPPYVSVKGISSNEKAVLSKIFLTGAGRFNLFTLFLEKGQTLLKENGTLTFILPQGLYSNIEYRHIRKYILDNTSIVLINLFSDRVFESSVDTSVISFINRHGQENQFNVFRDLNHMTIQLDQEMFNKLPYNLFPVNLTVYSFPIISKLLENNYDRIEGILEIQQGIIYSGQLKNKVFSNSQPTSKYKKVLDGRDVLKWKINWKAKHENKYIHYSNELHRPREERLFIANEKLLLPRKSTTLSCAYDCEQYYALNTAYIGLLKNSSYSLKYILACLNSKLLNYLYSKIFFGWQVTIPALNLMPITRIPYSEQKPIIDLVDQILAITKDEDYQNSPAKKAKVKELERQIDQMVYELYGLTPDEIAVVEGRA